MRTHRTSLFLLIILIIAAIAIPNLLRARRSANEGSATASMRTVGSGELLYNSTNGAFGTLAQLSSGRHMMEWYSRCAKIHPTLFRAEVCRDRGGDTAALPVIACSPTPTTSFVKRRLCSTRIACKNG